MSAVGVDADAMTSKDSIRGIVLPMLRDLGTVSSTEDLLSAAEGYGIAIALQRVKRKTSSNMPDCEEYFVIVANRVDLFRYWALPEIF